jgi:Antidote-toxin recognition MazE, bacterial antitoxin
LKKPVVFFETNKILRNRNLNVKLFGSGLVSWSEKSNLNITYVLLYVIVVYLTECLAKTRKVGGSLVVTLPKELVEANKIKEGEIIEISIKKLRKDGFGVLKGVGPFTAQDELTTDD